MERRLYFVIAGLLIALIPSVGRSQSADRRELDQWLKASERQADLPNGTKITMANWQQYKQFMPLGMIKLFEGNYGWKMPADVAMDVGPATKAVTYPRAGLKRPRNTARRLAWKSCRTGTMY
jgi:hypothetical protein